jgi:hypothetical protein
LRILGKGGSREEKQPRNDQQTKPQLRFLRLCTLKCLAP